GTEFPGSIQGSSDAARASDPAGSSRPDRRGLLGHVHRLPLVVEPSPAGRGRTTPGAVPGGGIVPRQGPGPGSPAPPGAGDPPSESCADGPDAASHDSSRAEARRAGPDRTGTPGRPGGVDRT